jgi:hypothetical protein
MLDEDTEVKQALSVGTMLNTKVGEQMDLTTSLGTSFAEVAINLFFKSSSVTLA